MSNGFQLITQTQLRLPAWIVVLKRNLSSWKTEYHDGRELCAMGMWVSQVELCNHRFVTSDLYSIEWINGGLELLITSRRNSFLISSTEIVSTNEFYFTVFVNIKLNSQGRTESCRNIHLTFFFFFFANG